MAYDVFISYSRSVDEDFAAALRAGLQQLGKPWNKRRALNVFLDQASLEASAGLESSLEADLDSARYFVLLASPESARSRWANQELAYWLESRGSSERLRLVLTGGDIVWDEAAGDFDAGRSTAIGVSLRGAFSEEPLWLDMRWARSEQDLDLRRNPRFKDDLATLAAPMHGISKEELVGADLDQFRRSTRLRRAAITGLAVLTATAGFLAFLSFQNAERANDEADRANTQASIAKVNEERANNEADRAFATALAARAEVVTVQNPALALALAVESLEVSDNAPPEATGALLNARVALAQQHTQQVGGRIDVHHGAVASVQWQPSGDLLVSVGVGGEVRMSSRDGPTVTSRQVPTPDGGALRELAWSADGTRAAYVGNGGRTGVFDVASGEELPGQYRGDTGRLDAVALSPDGRLLAVGGTDGCVRIFDVDEGTPIGVDTTPPDRSGLRVRSMSWSDNGRYLAFAEDPPEGAVWVVDVAAAESFCEADRTALPKELDAQRVASVTGGFPQVAWAPGDDSRLAIGGGPDIVIWNRRSGGTVNLDVGLSASQSISWSRDGRYLAVGTAADGMIGILDPDAPDPLGAVWRAHIGGVSSLSWHSDGGVLASSWSDGIKLWNLQTTEPMNAMLTRKGGEARAAWSPEAEMLAVGVGRRIELWSTEPDMRGEVVAQLPDHDAPVQSLEWSPDGSALVSSDSRGAIYVWDVAAQASAWASPFRGHQEDEQRVRAVAWSSGSGLIATGGERSVRVLDPSTGGEVFPPLGGHIALAVDWSPDGRRVAIGTDGSAVLIWEPAGGSRAQLLGSHRAAVLDIAWSPDGTTIASASVDGLLLLWDAESGRKLTDRPTISSGGVTSVEWSTDGAMLITGSSRGQVQVWTRAGDTIGAPLVVPGFGILSAGWWFEGHGLFAAGSNGDVLLWDVFDTDRACDIVRDFVEPAQVEAFFEGTDRSTAGCVGVRLHGWPNIPAKERVTRKFPCLRGVLRSQVNVLDVSFLNVIHEVIQLTKSSP